MKEMKINPSAELSNLLTVLQLAEDPQQIFDASATFCKRTGCISVAFYQLHGQALEKVAGDSRFQSEFTVTECTAMARVRTTVSDEAVPCRHTGVRGACCFPLVGLAEVHGLLVALVPLPSRTVPFLKFLAEQLGLALAALKRRIKLRTEATIDPLTGLGNRRLFETVFSRELTRAQHDKSPLALLFLDLDFFKRFNDLYGHPAGDAFLSSFGDLLSENVHGCDYAVRLGGEEFGAILVGADSSVAHQRAEALRRRVKLLPSPTEIGSTISIGIAIFPDHGATQDQLIKAADAALYRAKICRDCIELAAAPMPEKQPI